METVFTKEELLRVIVNWLFLQKPKDAEIKFRLFNFEGGLTTKTYFDK